MRDEFYYKGGFRKECWWWPFPIAYSLGGSSAVVFGRAVYGRGERPLVRRAYRFFSRIRDAKYAVMYRVMPKHQYHIVRTDLEPGYYDQDTRILHACMACLKTYVEIECGGADKLTKFSGDLRQEAASGAIEPSEGLIVSQASSQDEAVAIYRWWTIERPRDQARERELLHELYGNRPLKTKEAEHPDLVEIVVDEFEDEAKRKHDEHRALQRKICRDENEMLIRLMKIRGSLWT